MARILVTGSAGFIGYHVSLRLLARGDSVLGLDNLNDYYDVQLKRDRLDQLTSQAAFTFLERDIADRGAMETLFGDQSLDAVIHLAAQPGVRYSLENPHAYVDSNLTGFVNVLEGCRQARIGHLVFASSSSVYGANTRRPYSIHHNVDHPVSLYAATKKSNELLAHTYSHLFQLPTTGLRFFTVYGPWGRPDMAAWRFTERILAGQPIDVYNHGKMRRDFTYIDDIADGVIRVADQPAAGNACWDSRHPDPGTSRAPYRIYNIGNNQPVELLAFIETLEQCLGITARKNLVPLQPGDVLETYADIEDLTADVGFRPTTSIQVGLQRFVEWYREYHPNAPG